MQKIKWLIFFLFGGFLFNACLDQIQLNLPKGLDEGLVIQGLILKGEPNQIEVVIRRMFNFDVSSFAIINASQVLVRSSNDQELLLRRRGEGIYSTEIPSNDPNFLVDYDLQYRVEIIMPDGRTIHSTYEPLLQVPKMDSISHRLELGFVPSSLDKDQSVLDSFVRFSISTPLRASNEKEAVRFRWQSERTYKLTELPFDASEPPRVCYITEAVNIYDPQTYDPYLFPQADYLNQRYNFDQIFSYRLAEGYYFSIYQESLSEGAYLYWSQIGGLLNRDGNMFESQAGPVFTNFTNIDDPTDKIYGYFYCTERDTIRRYIPPEVYNQPEFCPMFVDGPTPLPPPRVCVDCPGELGSSLEPPPFWDP